MGIESIKVNNTSYPICPLIFDNEEQLVGRIGDTSLVSKLYLYEGDDMNKLYINLYDGRLSAFILISEISSDDINKLCTNVFHSVKLHLKCTDGTYIDYTDCSGIYKTTYTISGTTTDVLQLITTVRVDPTYSKQLVLSESTVIIPIIYEREMGE